MNCILVALWSLTSEQPPCATENVAYMTHYFRHFYQLGKTEQLTKLIDFE